MALEHDFRMYGFDQDGKDVIRAKVIAPLLPRMPFDVPDPEGLPHRLGWLNYWSADVAVEISFPDAEKDSWLLPLAHRTASGAWLVKLTPEPLDLTEPAHVAALARAYWRFDKIGKRMKPVAKHAGPSTAAAKAPSAVGSLKTFVIRERDEAGNWWDSTAERIRAPEREEALRIFFAKSAYSRLPREKESLARLRKAYDGIAAEVGLVRSEDVDAVEAGEEAGNS